MTGYGWSGMMGSMSLSGVIISLELIILLALAIAWLWVDMNRKK